MKIILTFITLMITTVSVFPQNQPLASEVEIFMGTFNVGENYDIYYSLDKVSDVKIKQGNYPNYSYSISDDLYCHPWYKTTGESSPPSYQNWNGFNFYLAYQSPPNINFAYALYKLIPKISPSSPQPHSDANIYIDYRDQRYPSGSFPSPNNTYDSYGNDIWIKYIYDGNGHGHFEYSLGWIDNFTPLSNGSTISIWGLKEITNDALILLAENNHPKLVWGSHPIFNDVSNYLIYRATTLNPVPNPRILNYQLRATVNSATFYWIDPDVYIGGPNYNYYYVKPNNSNAISNIVGTSVSFYKRNNDYNNFQDPESKLSQNFPNPFNPITKITYTIPEKTFVQLKIYDPFGKEVAVLVNESKEVGNYEVEFNAGNLASGIYFYQLKTTGFISTKKMLIVKWC
jgi:hypothetical protein